MTSDRSAACEHGYGPGECLLGINGKRWTTIEIHEAGRRLMARV